MGQYALQFLMVASGVYLAGWLTNLLSSSCGLALVPCWVASGATLVAMILLGPSAIPAAWLGMFGLQLDTGQSIGLAFTLAAVKIGASVVGLVLLKKHDFKAKFQTSRDVALFCLYGAGLAMFLSGGLAAIVLLAQGTLTSSTFLMGWWNRWWMDALGLLLLGPPLLLSFLAWRNRNSKDLSAEDWNSTRGTRKELSLALAGLVATSLLALDPFKMVGSTIPDTLLLPFLVWIALRGSKLLAAWVALGVAAVALWREILLSETTLTPYFAIHREETWAFLGTVTMMTLLISTLRHHVHRTLAEKQEVEVLLRVGEWSKVALDHLPIPILISNGDGTIAFINHEFTQQYGYAIEDTSTLEALRQWAFPELHGRSEAMQWRNEGLLKLQGTTGWSDPSIYTVVDKHGHHREVEVRMQMDGSGVISSVVDLTERLSQLEEISRLNRFLLTLSQVNQCLVRCQSRDELFRDVCEVAVAHGGFPLAWVGWVEPESLRVVPVAYEGPSAAYLESIRVTADDTPSGDGPVGLCIRGARSVVCNDISQDECMIPWRDRAQSLSLRSLMAVPIRKGGIIRGALVVYSRKAGEFQEREVALLEEMAVDISFALDSIETEAQRKRSEEALQKSESQLRIALEGTGIGMWDWDTIDDVWFATPTFFQTLGYEPTESPQVGKLWTDRVPKEDLDRLFTCLKSIQKGTTKKFDIEIRIRHQDGSYRWIQSIGQATGYNTEGKVTRVLGLQVEITQRKILEDQLMQSQKLEAIGQLAGGIAHDFNNILGAITGFVELASLKMNPDDLGKHDLDQALNAAHRGALLTNSLLTFGRKQPMKMENLDLSKVVANFEKFLLRLIPEDITLTFLPAPGPMPVMADQTQLEQILMNLVTNARDAMSAGGAIVIETQRAESCPPARKNLEPRPKGHCAVLSVKDTGIGIPEAIQSKVFDPFFTTKELGRGTGLGLATIYGIVERHGGFVELDSRMGLGTTFLVHLPLITSGAASVEAFPELTRRLPQGTETILFAEDDAAIRLATGTILRRHGYTVIEAADGKEAIDLFAEMRDQIDLVVLDGIMPRMDGWEAWTAIRLLKPDIRAVFISGYSEEIFRVDGAAREGMEILAKPFHSADILAKVREVLDAGKK